MENNIPIKIDEENNTCIINLNPSIYPMEVIYTAAYIFIDKAYIILDGDTKKEIKVILKPKEDYDVKKLGLEFYNELLSYVLYYEKNKQNRVIRDTIIQRALLGNDSDLNIGLNVKAPDPDFAEIEKEIKDIESKADDDIEDIAIPWEDKYGETEEEEKGKESSKENSEKDSESKGKGEEERKEGKEV